MKDLLLKRTDILARTCLRANSYVEVRIEESIYIYIYTTHFSLFYIKMLVDFIYK